MIFKTLLTSVAVSMAVASYAQAAIQDGTFEGTANGKNGPVTVAVTIKAGKIANVKVVKSGESAMIGDAAIARIPAEIVARQSLGVNNVAGASLTSMAIKAAATTQSKRPAVHRASSTKLRLRNPLPTLMSATKQLLSLSVPAPAVWPQPSVLS